MASSSESLSIFSMIRATLRHRRAVSLAVALGVATATAVITGALLVGDSMRGSLRGLTVERLGTIETVLAPGTFFPVESVELPSEASDAIVSSMILFPGGSVETKTKAGEGESSDDSISPRPRTRHVGGIQVVGVDESFWDFDSSGVRPDVMPDEDSVVLNQTAASELRVTVGDQITLRLPVEGAVPADSPLGKREIQSEGLPRMKVAAILPDQGLGRFSLMASQTVPRTVFVSRKLVAEVLDREGQANVMLSDRTLTDSQVPLSLQSLGWNLRKIEVGDAVTYLSLTSESLLLPETAVDRIVSAFPEGVVTPVLTYLANAIEPISESEREPRQEEQESGETDGKPSVPYSTIAAIDSGETLSLDYAIGTQVGGAASKGGKSSDEIPIVLNDWAANRLKVDVGATVRVFYYEPEVERGKEIERSFEAVVTDVVPITRPIKPYRRSREAVYDKPLTPYNDPNLTPDVPGVTDQDSISDWELPFQLERRIDRADDDYWNEHRLTPKAFIPLDAGRAEFGSRFGQTTGLRIDPQYDLQTIESKILEAIKPIRDELGWTPRAIRSEQLAASKGTTPFDGLFLALSMFVIMAAMMLIAILLRLGVLQRIDEFGTLLAVGFSPRRVMTLVMGETAVTASIGAIVGVIGGVGYAAFVLWALRSWWVGAVTVPFLRFHATPTSILLGGICGWAASMATALWTLRFLLKLNPAALLGGRRMSLAGGAAKSGGVRRTGGSLRPWIIAGLVVAAVAAAMLGSQGGAQEAAGGFVGGGMLLLIASLMWIHSRLGARAVMTPSLRTLATANARRNPLRSTLTIGLVATAAFLILSITAFRMSPTEEGTGGFDLIAESGSPIARDLNDSVVREELLGRDAGVLDGATLVAFRMLAGDDASCNNLYQSARPTVLGVPAFVSDEKSSDAEESSALGTPDDAAETNPLRRFGWASSEATEKEQTWSLLARDGKGTPDDPIPVVIDQNTAMWSLQMTGGIGQTKMFDYGAGKQLHFKVVGLLAGSVLQGKLLIGEVNFEKAFPEESGYRYFLIRRGEQASQDAIVNAFESRLVDVGMDVQSANEVLANLLAVQNTYLRTFQSLGALGLLLGTIGLAVSQLRSVLERRNELAVLQAVGFTHSRLAKLILGENFYLLLMGMACGVATAIVAVLPYAWMTGNSVPIVEPMWILFGILVFGMLAGMIAVWRVMTLPLLDSLRAEHAAIEL
ncbi:ABC transporter permease [Rhodopirellula sallentina]|nr:ABC transporter permease [Rhodopirellula sallentina]